MKQDTRTQSLLHLPSEVWTQAAHIDELKGRWIAGAQLNPQALGRLKHSVLVTSSGASTRIEGAHLSDEEVERLMRGLSAQKLTDRDEQEVRGYFELLQNMFESWRRLQLSESTIKHFHKELLKYVEKDKLHRGEYKKHENKVVMVNEAGRPGRVIFDTTAPYLTPKQMQELVEWTRAALNEKKIHPLMVIGVFIVEFLKIHPFQDGNGRLSRILTNLLLLQAGYEYIPYVSHEKRVEENKTAYYLALRKTQNTWEGRKRDLTPWLNFFLAMISEQSKAAIALLSEENVEKLLSPKQLAVWQYLQEVQEAAPAEIAKNSRVARPTVNQALMKLLKLKKVQRLGEGRSTRYRKVV